MCGILAFLESSFSDLTSHGVTVLILGFLKHQFCLLFQPARVEVLSVVTSFDGQSANGKGSEGRDMSQDTNAFRRMLAEVRRWESSFTRRFR